MPLTLRIIFLITFIVFINGHSFSFGKLQDLIKDVSSLIKKEPANYLLYLKRSKLYAEEGYFEKAQNDLKTAKKLKGNHIQVNLAYAEFFQLQQKGRKALSHINKALKSNGNHVLALKIRSSIRSDLTQSEQAIIDYEHAMQNLKYRSIDNYLELAELYHNCNDIHGALEVLYTGCAELGNLNALQIKKIELLKVSKKWSAVLNEIDEILKKQRRKEYWYYEKAEILYNRFNLVEEAEQNYHNALTIIKSLPESHRHSADIQTLETKVKSQLEFLKEQTLN